MFIIERKFTRGSDNVKKFDKKVVSLAFAKSLPIMCSYVFLSIAYGVTMAKSGLAWYWSLVASLSVFSGALLFVLVSFLAGGAPLLTVAVTSLLMSSRHCFYTLTFLDEIKRMGRRKPYIIYTMTDEIYAVDCTLDLPESEKHDAMLLIALFSRSSWMLGAVLGGVAGQFIPFDMSGIDFCMTALFVIIVLDQWKSAENRLPALSGLVIGAACLLLFGAGSFIMPALLLTSAVLLVSQRGGKKA